MTRDLSIIIAARNEVLLQQTLKDVCDKIRGNTEIIVIADGYWPDPPIKDHPRLTIVHHDSIGQRAAVNEGARISQAKYIMKLDAHCSVDKSFDVKLMQDCQPDWTMVPMMYNLHAFDWVCKSCGDSKYQGVKPEKCEECGSKRVEMKIVWKRKKRQLTTTWRFDKELQFQYWREHSRRPESQGDIVETMSFIGACMFLERKRFWELGGMDEAHGSWGQFGTEWACKSWLSGGKLMTTKKTWFAHMFRTGNFRKNGAHSSWPYPIKQSQINVARDHSRDLWMNNKWPLAKHSLQWLIDRFKPVPEWHD